MSFILDAITKSERERQQLAIPDARELAMPTQEAKRKTPVLAYIAIAALVINILALLIWWQIGSPLVNRSVESRPTTAESPDSASANADLRPLATKLSNISLNESVSATDRTDKSTLPEQTPGTHQDTTTINEPKPARMALLNAPSADKHDGTAARISTMMDRPGKSPATTPDPLSRETTLGEPNARLTQTDPKPQSATPELESKPPPLNSSESLDRKVYRLHEIPAGIKNDLPTISFNGHLFSKNKKVSYVMIDDGRLVKSGQPITDDILLHEVTPSGAVVDFREHLIELEILQNWSSR